jgi:predicted transcriptional regulator
MSSVSSRLKEVLARAETWPPALQEEAVETLLTLEEQGTGIFHISDEVWADMQEGLAQAERREFVSDEEVAKANKRYGI